MISETQIIDEWTLISDCITKPDESPQALEVLTVDMFTEPGCRDVFKVFVTLQADGLPTDINHTIERLENVGLLNRSLCDRLHHAAYDVRAPQPVAYYAQRVLEHHRKRCARDILLRHHQNLLNGHRLDETMTELQDDLQKLQVNTVVARARRRSDLNSGYRPFSLAYHPDGKSLVAGDLMGIITHWDLAEAKPVREFDAKIFHKLSYIQDVGGVRWLAFDAEGKTLAAAGGQPENGGFVQAVPTLRFINWTDGTENQTLKLGENQDGFVHEVAFHPQGFWIGVCSGQPGRGKYFLHRAGEEQPFFTNNKPLRNCHSLALHPNGARFAVISNDGTYGQKKSLAREGDYPGNTSPINLFDLVLPTAQDG